MGLGRDGSRSEAASNVTVMWRDTDVLGKSTSLSILEHFAKFLVWLVDSVMQKGLVVP